MGFQFARDFTKSPYTDDEKRIVNWLHKIGGSDVGGGDDPIGFFMASYETVIHERRAMKLQIAALQTDNDRLANLAKMVVDVDTIRKEAYDEGFHDGERQTNDLWIEERGSLDNG